MSEGCIVTHSSLKLVPGSSRASIQMLQSRQTFMTASYEDRLGVRFRTVRCRNRLGIRMTGPRPQFARSDGGEGGSHPSNVHDHVYAIGTINFTGAFPALPPPAILCLCHRQHPHHLRSRDSNSSCNACSHARMNKTHIG